jgi:hypothetical protein
LDALFADWKVVESYVPAISFPGREGRELVRVLKKPAV